MRPQDLPNRMDVPGAERDPHSGGDPILRSWEGYDAERKARRRMYARGGLHYLRGNRAPHFSLTLASWIVAGSRKSGGYYSPILREDCFGAAHDEIVARWPELAPLAALHLCGPDGAPMHAAENGFYSLAGWAGGVGERYCAGNGSDDWCVSCHGPLPSTYRSLCNPPFICEHGREKALERWAEHVRVHLPTARKAACDMLERARNHARMTGYRIALPEKSGGGYAIHEAKAIGAHLRQLHAAFIDGQRERWQQEADACVEALGLRYYYGERMPAAKVAP